MKFITTTLLTHLDPETITEFHRNTFEYIKLGNDIEVLTTLYGEVGELLSHHNTEEVQNLYNEIESYLY